MTERVGLIGWPVGHSISPAMQNAAFAELGMDWNYELLPIPPERLGEEVKRLLDAGYRGTGFIALIFRFTKITQYACIRDSPGATAGTVNYGTAYIV